MRQICTALAASLLFVSCSLSNEQEVSSEDELTIIFTGDVLLDRGVRPYAEREGVKALFAGVDSVFRKDRAHNLFRLAVHHVGKLL